MRVERSSNTPSTTVDSIAPHFLPVYRETRHNTARCIEQGCEAAHHRKKSIIVWKALLRNFLVIS